MAAFDESLHLQLQGAFNMSSSSGSMTWSQNAGARTMPGAPSAHQPSLNTLVANHATGGQAAQMSAAQQHLQQQIQQLQTGTGNSSQVFTLTNGTRVVKAGQPYPNTTIVQTMPTGPLGMMNVQRPNIMAGLGMTNGANLVGVGAMNMGGMNGMAVRPGNVFQPGVAVRQGPIGASGVRSLNMASNAITLQQVFAPPPTTITTTMTAVRPAMRIPKLGTVATYNPVTGVRSATTNGVTPGGAGSAPALPAGLPASLVQQMSLLQQQGGLVQTQMLGQPSGAMAVRPGALQNAGVNGTGGSQRQTTVVVTLARMLSETSRGQAAKIQLAANQQQHQAQQQQHMQMRQMAAAMLGGMQVLSGPGGFLQSATGQNQQQPGGYANGGNINIFDSGIAAQKQHVLDGLSVVDLNSIVDQQHQQNGSHGAAEGGPDAYAGGLNGGLGGLGLGMGMAGALGSSREDLKVILVSIGQELARHGISVETAVTSGWLGVLSPMDVAILADAYAEEERRMQGQQMQAMQGQVHLGSQPHLQHLHGSSGGADSGGSFARPLSGRSIGSGLGAFGPAGTGTGTAPGSAAGSGATNGSNSTPNSDTPLGDFPNLVLGGGNTTCSADRSATAAILALTSSSARTSVSVPPSEDGNGNGTAVGLGAGVDGPPSAPTAPLADSVLVWGGVGSSNGKGFFNRDSAAATVTSGSSFAAFQYGMFGLGGMAPGGSLSTEHDRAVDRSDEAAALADVFGEKQGPPVGLGLMAEDLGLNAQCARADGLALLHSHLQQSSGPGPKLIDSASEPWTASRAVQSNTIRSPRGGAMQVMQAAVRRYLRLWLPLLSHHPDPAERESLIPPLDVALVWMLHRALDIHAYVDDCNMVALSSAAALGLPTDREPELLGAGTEQALGFGDGEGAVGAFSAERASGIPQADSTTHASTLSIVQPHPQQPPPQHTQHTQHAQQQLLQLQLQDALGRQLELPGGSYLAQWLRRGRGNADTHSGRSGKPDMFGLCGSGAALAARYNRDLTGAPSKPASQVCQRYQQCVPWVVKQAGLTKLVSQLTREGQWSKGLEVFDALDAVGLLPDTTITNAAISACDKGGQCDHNIECDAVTCCSLITALDKGGQWQLGEQVFFQMYADHPQFKTPASCASPVPSGSTLCSLNTKKSAPNRVCCNALLAAYARATPTQWQRAIRLLELMWQIGGELCPDIVSYNTVIKACGNAGQVYCLMRRRGIEPSVATYGTLVCIAADAGASGRVIEVWGWLRASGLEVHVTCANAYLAALIKQGEWDAAVGFFRSLLRGGSPCRPNTITFNTLMAGCLDRGQPEQVLTLFHELQSVCGLAPSVSSYGHVVAAYGGLGRWEDAFNVVAFMYPHLHPDTACHRAMIGAFAAVGEVDVCVELFNPQSPTTHVASSGGREALALQPAGEAGATGATAATAGSGGKETEMVAAPGSPTSPATAPAAATAGGVDAEMLCSPLLPGSVSGAGGLLDELVGGLKEARPDALVRSPDLYRIMYEVLVVRGGVEGLAAALDIARQAHAEGPAPG
eukprot:XP_001690003.1 predicted protein [Chlamydomonas reinhardtii]